MNAIEMLELIRDNINESTASFWTDINLMRRLNIAQRKWGVIISMTPGQWLVKSASVTPVASVITLPADCAKPIYLEETVSGYPIDWLSSVTHRRVSRSVGTSLAPGANEAYPLVSTIEVNKVSFTTACTLWYQQRVPDLCTGVAGASTGASALHFAANLNTKFIDDYYNGVIVEVVDASTNIVDVRSEITDFTAATGIAVISGTPAANDTYGTISVLPEEVHMLLVMDATIMALMKPSSVIDKDVLKFYISEFRRMEKDVESWLASRVPGQEGTLIGDAY